MNDDFHLDSYDFELPQELIAQYPPQERGRSRLMVLRGDEAPIHAIFGDLAAFLPKGALLVANNSRVIHARLKGERSSGGRCEFLLLTPLPLIAAKDGRANVEGLIRPAARIRPGDRLRFGKIELEVCVKGNFGNCTGILSWQGDLAQTIEQGGCLPLPPYIRREPEESDAKRYQTVYAKADGSVAAPTAGLHFTPEIIASLAAAGLEWAEISLHVGYGTFSPVRCADIREHAMHAEYVEIPRGTAEAVKRAKSAGRPVIAIGTTSARALEGATAQTGEIRPWAGMTDIFLYPGASLRIIDGLITNFHLPKSSLLMLVSAFAGRERILAAYSEAIRSAYRFFSYGDAMLILP